MPRHLGGEGRDGGVGDRGGLGGGDVDEGWLGLGRVIGGVGGGVGREGLRDRHDRRVGAVSQPLGGPVGVGQGPVDGVAVSGVRARIDQFRGELASDGNQSSTDLDSLVLVDNRRLHLAQPVSGPPGGADQAGHHHQRYEDQGDHRRPPQPDRGVGTFGHHRVPPRDGSGWCSVRS